ncbi:cytochrome b/b6 domain-containing protein [Litoreibacter sp.]|nr:cytochrome b/b6 domain-containing protein [Litoreibacter sp.]
MRSNSQSTYGSVTKTIHWLMAALVISMIPLGIVANGMADADALKPTLFSLHKTLGVTIFFLAIARIAWAISQPKPAGLHPERKVESFLAELVHWLLYASLIIVPLSGWVHHAATTGFAPIWWPLGQNLPFIPKSEGLAHISAALHIIFERVLAVSIILHVAGALKHHFLDRDATLHRMLPGHTEPETALPTHQRSKTPLFAAAGIYVLALGVGAGLGLFTTPTKIATPELAETQSEWVVQDGTLAITVRQLGSDVEGSFADWTAAIDFDETADTDGKFGDVEVTISIPSLTLGSVTQQALGADFFDAEAHKTATYRADIFAEDHGYVAKGTLSIRGREAPVFLPFSLQIEGDKATMTGQTRVNRTNFQIGSGTQPTEGSLAFDVAISVTLSALRN